MARQRFIWPSMWTDKNFGELKPDEQLLFVGLFSLADDEGRLSGDPMFLRAQVFPYKAYSVKKVRQIRDAVVAAMKNVHLYRIGPNGEEAIALLKWQDFQKPKYPKPSKVPPPFLEDSGNPPASLPPRVGLDRDGMDRAVREARDAAADPSEQPSVGDIGKVIDLSLRGGAA